MVAQLSKLQESVPPSLLSALPGLSGVKFEPHDWPEYIPHRLHIGTFHDPTDGAMNLPVWAYLHPTGKPRVPLTMELGSYQDLGGDDEENWDLFYENIRHDQMDNEPVQLISPFKVERSRSDLFTVVKYYFLLAADAGMFEGEGIVYNDSFAQSMRAICRRVLRNADGPESSKSNTRSTWIKNEAVSDIDESESPAIVTEELLKRERGGKERKILIADFDSNCDYNSDHENVSAMREYVRKRRWSNVSSIPDPNPESECGERSDETLGIRRGKGRTAKKIASLKLASYNFDDDIKEEEMEILTAGCRPQLPKDEYHSKPDGKWIDEGRDSKNALRGISASASPSNRVKSLTPEKPDFHELNTLYSRSEALTSEISTMKRSLAALEVAKREFDGRLDSLIKEQFRL